MPLHLHKNGVPPDVRDELEQLFADDGVLRDPMLDGTTYEAWTKWGPWNDWDALTYASLDRDRWLEYRLDHEPEGDA